MKIMQKITAALAFFLLSASLFAGSAMLPPPIISSGEWQIHLFANQSALPDNSIVEIFYSDAAGRQYQTVVSTRNGSATIYPSATPSLAKFVYDLPDTPENDYVWEGAWNFEGNDASAVLKMVGSVYGHNAQLANKLVGMACFGGYVNSTVATSGGDFSFVSIPAGECTISVDGYKPKQIAFSHGEGIRVDDFEASLPDAGFFAFAAVIAIAAFYALWQGKPKDAPPQKTEPAPRKKMAKKITSKAAAYGVLQPILSIPFPSKRQSDLLATLNETERQIVEFAQKSHPAAVRASKIRNSLLIPKTTLTRTLSALERKQFIELKKDGSRMFVKLHGFFIKE